MGRATRNVALLKWEDIPLIWGELARSLFKGYGIRELLLFACLFSVSPASPFLHYHYNLLEIPACTEDQARRSALGTEQLLNPWTFCC